MNTFKTEYSSIGFTETLNYEGKAYVKRYKKDKTGYEGLDKAWEYEEKLPDELIEALEDRDEILIMDALEG